VARFQSLSIFGAGVERLFTFADALEQPISTPKGETIQTEIASELALEEITLQLPSRQRTLVEHLSIQLSAGEGLLVRGPSGCGKSSLLRAIAGLWDAGSGKVLRPALTDLLFLPQKPYMILGTLRDQILYPKLDVDIEEDRLKQVLAQVNLPDLPERHGGFDTEQDWAEVLSLGEQQRLIFARLLLNQPTYAILDEATSALDVENETLLYEQLIDSGITFLSVGHRPTLDRYHATTLTLTEQQNWSIESLEITSSNPATPELEEVKAS
jgi:vitamin B12/bleomycin/antimicrobial peptide transport system ATP-binding/permease protein